jgi:hypothetical protein
LNELLILVVFNYINPEVLNVDKIVVLFDIELYELTSYTPEIYDIEITSYISAPYATGRRVQKMTRTSDSKSLPPSRTREFACK